MLVRSAALSRKFWLATTVMSALVVQGCAGGVSRRDTANYDGLLAQGDYPRAALFAVDAGRIGADGASNNLLWSLDAGAAMVYAGDAAHTIPVLDHAEDMMKRRDIGNTGERGQYHAKTYDGVMVNAYKAIAAMEAGQRDLARTELLRADDRQRRAEDEVQPELARGQARQSQPSGFDFQGALQSVQRDAAYRDSLQELNNYGGYRPFINPFATYLTGLYFLNSAEPGDRERARDAFKRVRGMVGENALLDGDVALAGQPAKFSPKTWIIFENGQGSTLTEYSVRFPVPLIGKRHGVSVATVALPRLHENAPAAHGLLVGDGGERTVEVGNFDYVMRSEFRSRYPSIIAAALVEAAAKIAIEEVAAQEKTGLALLAATVVSNISSADVRSWTALPKDFQAARIDAPKDGNVRLRTDSGAELGTAKVPTNASSIVYVKMLGAGAAPAIHVLRF
jgi:hypothetical protein